MKVDFSQFEKKTGVVFKNKRLLSTAFTHRSYINENRDSDLEHNERLEFLGDAVLELIVTDYLFKKYPDKPEGELTSYRSALVNATVLGEIALKIGMNDFLLLSKGEMKDVGRARQVILANTIEAVIGAIFIDQGYDSAEKFVKENIIGKLETIVATKAWIDPKSRFQEKAQEIVGVTPTYKTVKETGPDHDKHFTVGVFIGEALIATGEGVSKQEAEQEAAMKGLEERGWK